MITMASLFDGSGGFPLASVMNGITPIWASEIEPYPLRVTALRFPEMKQYGDITKINGAEVEPVDIITFGSPCQDLSIAGAQKGIHEGERSNLFFEAIRIIKEMREHDRAVGRTDGIRPRFTVWENVTGAYSSNKGEDFRAVLEAFASICENGLSIPRPKKWNHAGCVVGNGWSLAWRTYDAQYWGVPQRRKRIYLVADFGSERAAEILFKSEGVSRNPAKSRTEGQDSAEDIERRFGETISFQERAGKPGGGKGILIQKNHVGALSTLNNQRVLTFEPGIASREGGHIYEDVSGTLRAKPGDNQMAVAYGISSYHSNAMRSSNPNSGIYIANIARTLDVTGGNPACNQGGVLVVMPKKTGTVPSGYGKSYTGQEVYSGCLVCFAVENHSNDSRVRVADNGCFQTLSAQIATGGNNQPLVLQAPVSFMESGYAQYTEGVGVLRAAGGHLGGGSETLVFVPGVRKLTPLECCRLQGFPDWWEDGADGSDTARYKMWGNGIALPCAVDVMRRIAEKIRSEEHE